MFILPIYVVVLEITNLINELLQKNKKVLVHCRAGINRSPSFVLAYLCKFHQFEFDQAIAQILVKRKSCRFSFRENVKKWLEETSS